MICTYNRWFIKSPSASAPKAWMRLWRQFVWEARNSHTRKKHVAKNCQTYPGPGGRVQNFRKFIYFFACLLNCAREKKLFPFFFSSRSSLLCFYTIKDSSSRLWAANNKRFQPPTEKDSNRNYLILFQCLSCLKLILNSVML